MESTAAAAAAVEGEEEEEWELCNDDGFVYKRKRRRLDPAEGIAARSAVDIEAEENQRRERKRKTLMKVKEKYEREIEQWEVLSRNLLEMEEKTRKLQEQYRREEQTVPFLEEVVRRKEIWCGSALDDLLSQVEAQEAVIQNVSKLCDLAEALSNKQEEQLKERLIDLPIWASPRELMASLCDE